MTVTLLEVEETEVRTVLPCLRSLMSAPEGPTVVPETVVAWAPVKVTVPKLAKGTSELPSYILNHKSDSDTQQTKSLLKSDVPRSPLRSIQR